MMQKPVSKEGVSFSAEKVNPLPMANNTNDK